MHEIILTNCSEDEVEEIKWFTQKELEQKLKINSRTFLRQIGP